MYQEKVFVVGIAGASGCGKSYFANIIKERLGLGTEIISCDSYYKSYTNLIGEPDLAPETFNWDTPNVLDLSLLKIHIQQLKLRKNIGIPHFNFKTSQREQYFSNIINGSQLKVLIVEGLFVLSDSALYEEFDMKIFTLLDLDICLARRMKRDVQERGNSYDKTIMTYQAFVKPAYVNFIEPSKRNADLIISTSEYTDSYLAISMIEIYIKDKITQLQ